MTQPTLSLVTTNTPSQTSNKPSENDKAVIADYVLELKRRGFCKIDDASSNQTRLLNRRNGKILPVSFIENDFYSWLRRNSKECSQFSTPYILRTLQHVIGLKFIPKAASYVTEPDTDCTFANTYREYEPTTSDADVSPLFHEYWERLFPAAEERHIVLQWIAHLIQHPEQRPSWHLLLTSEPGTGKGFLLQAILHPLLQHTSLVSSYKRVLGQFSTLLEDNLLILLDDCKARSDSTQTELKSLLSEERTYAERKHLQGSMVNTYVRFILASNEDKPLHFDKDERRWYVPAKLVHKESKAETQAFLHNLAGWLALPGSLCKVYNSFMSYSLEGFNHKCVPESAGLTAIIGMSKNPYSDFLAGFIAENTVFTYSDLIEALKNEGLTKPSDKHMIHLLREVGYEKSQPRIDGKLKRLCHPVGMPLEAIRTAYNEAEVVV